MANQRPTTPSSQNSPYYYGGGGTASTPKIKAGAGMGSFPGFTAPTSTLPIYTDPTRSAKNPFEFTGGASATDQLYKDFPNLIGAAPSINPQKALQDYLSGDQIRRGQIAALNAQLGSSWATDVISRARNLELQYGGTPRDAAGNPLDLGQFGGTAPLGFQAGDEAAPELGQSLASALLDPTLLQNASENRFSALATIARQLQGRDAAAKALYSGGGVAQSMAEHQVQANEATQQAANTFTSGLADLMSGWLGNYNTATGALGGYNQDAYNRMMGLIQIGAIDPFGTNAAAAAERERQYQLQLAMLRQSEQRQDEVTNPEPDQPQPLTPADWTYSGPATVPQPAPLSRGMKVGVPKKSPYYYGGGVW